MVGHKITSMHLLNLLAILLTKEAVADTKNEHMEIHIIFASSFSGARFDTRKTFEGFVNLALNHIHSRTDILPGYTIIPHFMDTQCDSGPALFNFFKEINSEVAKPIIVGPLCSQVCKAIGETSHFWNISTISGSCVAPELSDKSIYRRFFRVTEPETAFATTRLEILKLYNWNKIGVFYEALGPHPEAYRFTRNLLENTSVSIVTTEVINNSPVLQVESFKGNDVRILIGGAFPATVRSMFCEVYKQGFYGPHIVWILPGYYGEFWWTFDQDTLDCTPEQLLETIEDAIYVDISWHNPQDIPCFTGLFPSDIDRLIGEFHGNTSRAQLDFIAPNYYDATLAMGLALNLTESKLSEKGISLSDFQYSDGEIADAISESFFNLRFQGVSGYVSFNENGERPANVILHQQKGRKKKFIGWHDKRTNKINWENGGVTWRTGRLPVDSTVVIMETLFLSQYMYTTMCVIAGIGIIMDGGFIFFNVYFRNIRAIKMSSPKINTLILVGCIVSYLSVFFEMRKETLSLGNAICTARAALFVFGFSMVFGGLFSKTWRVHRILTKAAKSVKKTMISDTQLFLIVGLLVLVDAAILILWQSYDPYRVVLRNQTSSEIVSKFNELVVMYQLPSCTSDYATYFQGALFVVQGMMLAFGAFLAWETRKVTCQALNDSKLIGVCIYNVAILSVIGTAVGMVLVDNPDTGYVFTSSFKLAGTTLVSAVLFVPKVLAVKSGNVEPTGSILATIDRSLKISYGHSEGTTSAVGRSSGKQQ